MGYNDIDLAAVAAFDSSQNGMQVAGRAKAVTRVSFAVDASMESFRRAVERAAQLLVVHHGILWDRPLRIVNIASISAYTSSPARGEYCVSKAGVSMMTALFADRLGEHRIGVFEIRPGIVMTDMTKVVKEKYDKLIAEGLTPIRRWAYPEDVAAAVATCAAGRIPMSTGQVLDVDGGFHLRVL